MSVITSLLLFLLAGLFEIGGGYLIWIALKEGRGILCFIAGSLLLIGYGILPTMQDASFGRVYAAYGGIFIAMSLLWGYIVDKVTPDRFDLLGAAVALVGVAIIMYVPR